ncbi:testis-specific serine/threonine-protein kinase 6-like isoform X3 [Salminus brasiliensis]|uniref:testis-specific serine/threonine-protein kinase 6-like isoform X3 n=1 Tax=Salminus brasiliensis TaxID=930266 RepID=UPI003B831EF3
MKTSKELKSLGFKLIRELGEGSFGKVVLASSTQQRKDVAIKIIEPKQHSREYRSKFLRRELEILKTLRHPHIIEVHEIMVRQGQVLIVMEAAATDLMSKIQELHRIPIHQAKTWFSQLLSAVVYLHQRDIVHRDLKCDNVLLTADDQVKLTDFSFVRIYKGISKSRTFCCTVSYAAPEVLMGLPYDPKKNDVWSLGVILYIMVTGFMPFKTTSKRYMVYEQRKALVFPDQATVEEPCRMFITHLLQFDPSTRPSATEVEQHPWMQPRQESSPGDNVFGAPNNGRDGCSDIVQQQLTAVADSEENSRVIGRFLVVAVREELEGGSGGNCHDDINPLQPTEEELQSSSLSRAGRSSYCRSSCLFVFPGEKRPAPWAGGGGSAPTVHKEAERQEVPQVEADPEKVKEGAPFVALYHGSG